MTPSPDIPEKEIRERCSDILSQAAEHAQAAHNVQVTPELAEQLKTLIQDDGQS